MCVEKDTKSLQSRMTFAALRRVVYQSLFQLGVVSSAVCLFFSASCEACKAFLQSGWNWWGWFRLNSNTLDVWHKRYTWSILGLGPLPHLLGGTTALMAEKTLA